MNCDEKTDTGANEETYDLAGPERWSPAIDWVKVVMEVYGHGRPHPRPRTGNGGRRFLPSSNSGPYGHLEESELWILAAWNIQELFMLLNDQEVGGVENRRLARHYAVLCAICGILGEEEFEARLGGLIEGLDQNGRGVAVALAEPKEV
jgi:hypothetical protein